MAKRYYLIVSLFIASIQCLSAQLESKVNECFELVSIAFRLADAGEYVNNDIPGYAGDVDAYFSKCKNHKLFPYLQELREKYGVSYDAVMCAAAGIRIEKGKVLLLPHCEISKMDSRWTDATYKTFIAYLNDFYGKSKFREFYTRHSDVYKLAEEKVNQVLGTVNTQWFESVWGVGLESPVIIASLSNGRSNYAFTRIIAGQKKIGIVVGCEGDSNGLPTCRFDMDYIVVHELLHGYTNPLVNQYWNQLKASVEKIYSSTNSEILKEGPYNHPKAMMFEWFARLLSLMYFKDNPQPDKPMALAIRNMENLGFIWTARSMLFMEHFYNNRQRYPYLQDYMGQIIEFIRYTADNMAQVSKEHEDNTPYVVDTYPVAGSYMSGKVDTVQIRFSRAMINDYKPVTAKKRNKIAKEELKELPVKGSPLWKDEYTFVIPVDTNKLEQGKYSFFLYPRTFRATNGYPIQDTYTYIINMSR